MADGRPQDEPPAPEPPAPEPPAREPPSPEPPASDPQVFLDAAAAFLLFLMIPAVTATLLAPTADSQARVVNGSLVLMSGIVPLVGYALYRRRALPWRFRIKFPLLSYLGFAAVWVPLAMFLYPVLVRAAGYEFTPQEAVVYLARSKRGPELYLVILVACVGAPIAEEIFFRGFVYRAVEVATGSRVAVVATAIFFGMVHEPSVAVPIGVLGLFLGYLRMKTRGVGASILVHIVHNVWTVVLVLLRPDLIEVMYDR